MCGITGLFFENQGQRATESELTEIVSRMTDSLAKRGPDAAGLLIESPVALGHRRLSILDLSESGAQPMRLGKAGPIITFNGEIYNYLDLRRELTQLGRDIWRGHSDTEVILNVYDQWGLDGLKKLEGIFALALWDPSSRRFLLMRDRLGMKPLFFAPSRFGLAFGSEIKSVLEAGDVDTRLDDQSLAEYLWYGNSHGARTIYTGVRSLEPGHWLVIEKNHERLEPWWKIEDWLIQAPKTSDLEQATIEVQTALDLAVKRQLMADVPIGLFLSGGIDSSAIAAAATQASQTPLQSFTADFDFTKNSSEMPKAARVARHLNLTHHEIHIRGSTLSSTIRELANAHDEPFADAANLPIYLMCKELHGLVKVVLQGDGGDELFGGYRRYSALDQIRFWRLWPTHFDPLLRPLGSLGARFSRVAEAMNQNSAGVRMAHIISAITPSFRTERLFSLEREEHLLKNTNPLLPYLHAAERFRNFEPVQQMLLTDLTVQLPSTYLPKVDRASMAAGIEVRVPLLDENLVRLAVNLPSKWKVRGGNRKIILRRAMKGKIPDDILKSRKMGFGVPFDGWMRGPLSEMLSGYLLDDTFLKDFSIMRPSLESAIKRHREGEDRSGFMLWSLFQLAIWNSHVRRSN